MARFGCHVSIGSGLKGVINAIEGVRAVGANFAQVFVSNPRSGKHSPNSAFDKNAAEIRAVLRANDVGLVIHAPYVLNFAREPTFLPSSELSWWVKTLLQELEICHNVGGLGVVVHVGKHLTLAPATGIDNMYAAFKFVLQHARMAGWTSKLILETAAGQGTELLVGLQEFLAFYDRFSADDKQNLGLCVDTCHAFAAGAGLDEVLAFIRNNHRSIALVHLNDSKGKRGSCVDRHERIGGGEIGEAALVKVVGLAKRHGIPLVLETPDAHLEDDLEWLARAI